MSELINKKFWLILRRFFDTNDQNPLIHIDILGNKTMSILYILISMALSKIFHHTLNNFHRINFYHQKLFSNKLLVSHKKCRYLQNFTHNFKGKFNYQNNQKNQDIRQCIFLFVRGCSFYLDFHTFHNFLYQLLD